MQLNELLVYMVVGHRLEERFGPRGGYQGTFCYSITVRSRTFGAARRKGFIEVASVTPERKTYKLTAAGALYAENLMAKRGYFPDTQTEHVFTHLVPGVEIYYNSATGQFCAYVNGREIARAWELMPCVEAARATGHHAAQCHICKAVATTLPDDPQGGLDVCGDCGKPTCAAHRVEGASALCTNCAPVQEVTR